MSTRRQILALGGGGFAILCATRLTAEVKVEVIEMRGTPRGEKVGFVPNGLAIAPGTTLSFVNRDPGNSHTTTAYHPKYLDRKSRIPDAAVPWNSDFLLPDASFEVTFTVPGVYDFYCQPHEMAGMVGRIVVGRPGDPGWQGASADTSDLMLETLAALPPLEAILQAGRVTPEGL